MKRVLIFLICCSVASANSILKRLEEERENEDVALDKDADIGEGKVADVEEDKDAVLMKPDVEKEKLTIEEVVPQDHIFGVKMERDGDENENYHKEVFLGMEMEKFKNGDYKMPDQQKKLKEIFAAVDLNGDKFVDESEMTDWVLTKTREHFYESRMNNERVVELLDANQDDEISWNEFVAHFLSENGFDKDDILTRLNADEKIDIPDNLAVKVEDLRQKWIRVQDVGKHSLSTSQFFEFQHPETSNDNLKYLVEDILHDMDTDNSNDITIQEYVALPPDADVDIYRDEFIVERAKEFRDVIDIDRDGKVTVSELEAYLDPLSRSMAAQEARELIGFGDSNEDGKLTLDEILENSHFYTGSKLYNYARSVHEEF